MKTSTNTNRIKLYLWIGLVYLSFWVMHEFVNRDHTFFQRVINNLWRLVYVMALIYTLFEYTVPYILLKRRYIIINILLAISFIFIYCMFFSFGLYTWRIIGIGLHIYTPFPAFDSTKHAISEQMGYSMMTLFFFGIIRHIYNYLKLKQAAQKLRIEKQSAELNYLKSQTNPHFLFNTLNNIYSLSRDKSDLAPESILRLSKILRFMLYETNGAFITIEQELKVINDYIELEKLRYDESLRINFNHNVEDMKQAIPPLLMIPLVENAFKHGVSETTGLPFIEIHLSVEKRRLLFVVKNSTEPISIVTSIKENIGLSNLRRQLELLYTDYNLTVHQGDSAFTATLKINLASHV